MVNMIETLKFTENDTLVTFSGRVIQGRKIGRKIGFPTANLDIELDNPLELGVYGVSIYYNQAVYIGLMNVGVRPTFKHEKQQINYEVHILNFDQVIYGKDLTVEVNFFVRKEIAFSNVDQLISSIKEDVKYVENRFDMLRIGKKTRWTNMYLITEDNINMPDLPFFELCEQNFGINRGVFNTIDSMFYEKGFKNIHSRRKEILTFLKYSFGEPKGIKCSRNKFGHGGLSLKLNEYCLITQFPM
jgi:riboflavin kinase